MAAWMVPKSQPEAHTVSVAGRGVGVGGKRVAVGGIGVTVGVAVLVGVLVGSIGVLVGVGSLTRVANNCGDVAVEGTGLAAGGGVGLQPFKARAKETTKSNEPSFLIFFSL
jgi:hypothetical protein